MRRDFVRAQGIRLTWEQSHPMSYLYVSPPELEDLKRILRAERESEDVGASEDVSAQRTANGKLR